MTWTTLLFVLVIAGLLVYAEWLKHKIPNNDTKNKYDVDRSIRYDTIRSWHMGTCYDYRIADYGYDVTRINEFRQSNRAYIRTHG